MSFYDDDTNDSSNNGSDDELQCIWNAYCHQLNAQVGSELFPSMP